MPANLKVLKRRIKSVKSTQKITKAMKLVSASKLKNAEIALRSSLPYFKKINEVISNLMCNIDLKGDEVKPSLIDLIQGNANPNTLIVVTSSDRGLCGSFNYAIFKQANKLFKSIKHQNEDFSIITVGSKAQDYYKSQFKKKIIKNFNGLSKKKIKFEDIFPLSDFITEQFLSGNYGKVIIVYSKFKSVISQEAIIEQLLPLVLMKENIELQCEITPSVYEFEPNLEVILEQLLLKSIRSNIYHAMLENSASEQGARMTAMDNATRNAGEMIDKLNLQYNRTRQGAITKELIEIISGAEAL